MNLNCAKINVNRLSIQLYTEAGSKLSLSKVPTSLPYTFTHFSKSALVKPSWKCEDLLIEDEL